MNQQYDLFDPPVVSARPLYRRHDPETSRDGAQHAAANLNDLQQLFIETLQSMHQATANEVACRAASARPNIMSESIRKRARELINLRAIRIVDYRPCSVSTRKAAVYEVLK